MKKHGLKQKKMKNKKENEETKKNGLKQRWKKERK